MIHGRVLASFPVSVDSANGIKVTKQNGVWTIENDWSDVDDIELGGDLSSVETLVHDLATDTYKRAGLNTIIERFTERINVKDFGAVGDGSTHPLSSVYGTLGAAQAVYPFATSLTQELDWAGIQKAYNLAGSRDGGEVVAPYGGYRVNARLVFDDSNVTIVGDGPGNRFQPTAAAGTTLTWTGAADEIFMIMGANAVGENTVYGGIKNLKIDGAAVADYGLLIQDMSFASFEDVLITRCAYTACALKNSTNAGNQTPTGYLTFRKVQLDQRNGDTNAGHGLLLAGAGTGVEGVTKCHFEDLYITHADGHGILVDGARGADNMTFVKLDTTRSNVETGYGVYVGSPVATAICGFWDIWHANVNAGFHIADAGVALGWRIINANDNELVSGGTLLSGAGAADPFAVGALNNTLYGRARTFTGDAVGSGSLATNATTGFIYVPTCAGTPSGTPATVSGYAPIVVNTTNHKLYFYSGGSWRDAGP